MDPRSPLTRQPKRRKRTIALMLLGALLLAALGAGLAAYKLVLPKMAQDALRSRLAALERDGQLQIKTATIEPDGLDGVLVRDLIIESPGQTQPLLSVRQVRARVDRAALLTGRRVLTALEIEGVQLHLTRDAQGKWDAQALMARLRAGRGPRADAAPEGDAQAAADPLASTQRLLRHFGGQWPALSVRDASLTFHADESWPLQALHMERATLTRASGGDAQLDAAILITARQGAAWSFPHTVTLIGRLTTPLEQSALEVRFDRPLRAAGLPPYPFVQLGLSGASVEPGAQLTLRDLTLDTTFGQTLADGSSRTPLLSAKQLQIKLKAWTSDPRKLELDLVKLVEPQAALRYARSGASDLDDLLVALAPPQAAHVRQQAEQTVQAGLKAKADALAAAQAKQTKSKARDPEDELPEDALDPSAPSAEAPSDEAELKPRGLRHQLMARLRDERLQRLIPNTLMIERGALQIQDERQLPVARPTRALRLSSERLLVEHDPQAQTLRCEGGFDARADGDQPRGQGSLTLRVDYAQLAAKADLKLTDLDLSWLAQLVGPRLSDKLRGGVFNASLRLDQERKGSPILFEGKVTLERAFVVWPKLAEEPIEASLLEYDFAGRYSPTASQATTRVSKPTQPFVGQGALVFTRGKAKLNQLEATFSPELHGLRTQAKRPDLLVLTLNLPKTPLQRALDSVPSALLGELAQSKIKGDVRWSMRLELPLNEPKEIAWSGEPAFEDLEILSMPSGVDVRKMTRGFTHTIVDEQVRFERKIKIQPMSLIPAEWLMLNANMTLEDVDAQRRRADWFAPHHEVPDDVAGSPEYWTSRWARAQAQPKPWTEGQAAGKRAWKPHHLKEDKPMVSSPYGDYVYVPLHHISPWMMRAILTTEDNSFFKHDGFNRHALRESIARNIREGDYVRGASTISMQTIKNLFLTRKKVMARKLQEAILVVLMEQALQVPKERIMEIYLNIIEFAPGVFGIHDAALHYFGKRPSELTFAECAWLVTIVPGPKKYHRHYMRGEISDTFWDRIKRYMRFIHTRERATLQEYEEAILERPAFYKPTEPDAPALRPTPSKAPLIELLDPDEPAPAGPTPPGWAPPPGPARSPRLTLEP